MRATILDLDFTASYVELSDVCQSAAARCEIAQSAHGVNIERGILNAAHGVSLMASRVLQPLAAIVTMLRLE